MEQIPYNDNDDIYIKAFYSNISQIPSSIHVNDIYELFKIPIIDEKGYCLDSSEPIFYYHPSISDENSTKYYIHFEDRYPCLTLGQCYVQSQNIETSMAKYAYISNLNATKLGINGWNSIYIKSCDGFLFLGSNENTISFVKKKRKSKKRKNVKLYFQGNIILNNLFKYLMSNAFDINNATEIVISGIGTSCNSVLSNMDDIYNKHLYKIQNVENIKIVLWRQEGIDVRDVNISWIVNKMNLAISNRHCLNDQCFIDDHDLINDQIDLLKVLFATDFSFQISSKL